MKAKTETTSRAKDLETSVLSLNFLWLLFLLLRLSVCATAYLTLSNVTMALNIIVATRIGCLHVMRFECTSCMSQSLLGTVLMAYSNYYNL